MATENAFMRFANDRDLPSDDFGEDEKLSRVGLAFAAMVIAAMRGDIDAAKFARILNKDSPDAYETGKRLLSEFGKEMFKEMEAMDEKAWKEKYGGA